MPRTIQLAVGSIAVSIVVLAVKYGAYLLTGSVALYSDALESIINVAAAIAALIALRVSAAPADARHPYGHSKAEYISAVIEGVLIAGAALAILREAYLGFLAPKALEAPLLGLAVSSVGTVFNGAWSWVLIRHGRRYRSPALIADGKHLLTDVVTSAGVVVGVLLVVVTGLAWLDPAIAALVALHVLWSGWELMRESVGGLMDTAVPESTLTLIKKAISGAAEGAIEAHDLKTRHAGRVTFIEFHLVVAGGMTVERSHEICDRLEAMLKSEVEHAVVTIHVEPQDKAKHAGIVVV